LSFFDEVDEPRTEPRRAPRTTTRVAPSRRRSSSSGGGRRPPPQEQSIQIRRAVAAAALVIVIVLIAVGVHSCQVSSRNSALRDYTNSVSSLITRSDDTGRRLFDILSSGGGSSNAINLRNQINETRQTAAQVLQSARHLDAPDSVKTADSNLRLALQMRVDGMTNIANRIESAVGGATSSDAVDAIAAETARFYASDVVYKDYTTTALASALHAADIDVGGSINPGQFVTDVQWLTPSFIASKLGVSTPGSGKSGKPTPGVHGHSLNSVSVNGTTLQTGSTNTVSIKPAPVFKLSLTNGGTSNEFNVTCSVSVTGTGASGQTVIPETHAGQQATCSVTLKSPPAAGTYTVVAKVGKVPGEKNLANNSLSFPVTFQ